jgi:hypothetical protein
MDKVQTPSDSERYSLRSQLNLKIATELQLERRECNNSVHLNPSRVANSVRPTKGITRILWNHIGNYRVYKSP